VPKVVIASILNPFEAPLPWSEVCRLERDLALEALAGAAGVRFIQGSTSDVDGVVRRLRRIARQSTLAVLTPPSVKEARELMDSLSHVDCVAFHQSLEPTRRSIGREFRLGAWSRLDKHRAALAWLGEQRPPAALHVGVEPPLIDVAHLRVDPRRLEEVDRAAATLPEGSTLLLEAGGATNRELCERLGRHLRFVFLNGNPTLDDPTLAGRCIEIVSNLPERLGPGISSVLASVRPNAGLPEREVAGMLAWRLDAMELIRSAFLELRQRRCRVTPKSMADRVASHDGSARVFHGLHRPAWFGADGSNQNRELVLATPDGHGGRRAIDLQPCLAAEARLVPTLDVDVDLIGINGVDAASGTFRAEAIIRVHSRDALQAESVQDCLRILNACDEGHWIPHAAPTASPHGNTLESVVRGEFTFEPQLLRYPFDRQMLGIRLAATGRHAHRVMRPIDGAADIDCRAPGWLVVGPHRAVTADARPVGGGTARVISGMEFGINVVRATGDIKRRVVLPLLLIVLLSTAIVLSSGGDDWLQNQAELLCGLFLAAVALYFSEPRPAPGVRTLVDAVFVRAFVFISILLLSVVISIHAAEPWPWAPVAGILLAVSICSATLVRGSWRKVLFGRVARSWRRRNKT
jgi:hypothetical protein